MLKRFLDTVPAVAFVVDLCGRFVYVNRRFEEVHGVTRKEVTGRTAAELFDLSCMQALYAPTSVPVAEVNCGGKIWMVSRAPLVDPSGRQLIGGYTTDVSDFKSIEAARHASDEQYRRVLESALDCIVTMDQTGAIVDFNPMAERVFGFRRDDVLGRQLSEVLVPPEMRLRHEKSVRRLRVEPRAQALLGRRIETIAMREDGTRIPVELLVQRTRISEPSLFTGFVRDISDRKQAERRILRLNRMCRMLSKTTMHAVHASDRKNLLEGACRIIRDEAGLLAAGVCLIDHAESKLRPLALSGPRDFTMPDTGMGADGTGGRTTTARCLREERIVAVQDIGICLDYAPLVGNCRDQGITSIAAVPLCLRGRAIAALTLVSAEKQYFDEDVIQLLGDMRLEIESALNRLALEDDHEEATRRLSHLAHYDQLTNLPNRKLFSDRLGGLVADARESASNVGLLVVDLDHFKVINDSHGHAAGDGVLRQASVRLRECVRGEDSIARLSANAFCIALAEVSDARHLRMVAEKILARLSRPYYVNGLELSLTASIGTVCAPGDEADVEMLLRNAEIAMFSAKAAGRNRVDFFTLEMSDRTKRRAELHARLRGALDRGEFALHYQPKVAVPSCGIEGFEALLRWQPAGGPTVSPAEFVPILEETGLIVEVGTWVVESACAQIAAWKAEGLTPKPVAINVSMSQLRQAGFCEIVRNAITRNEIDASLVEIEVTESSLMDDPDMACAILRDLKSLGIRLAIDDFGTGYSSLSYLRRFPFDTLKIDRSFIRDITSDRDGASITETIISLAHSLRLKVVGEGVEMEDQLEFLAMHRCDEIQGWLFSRAVPADECAALLRRGHLKPGRSPSTNVPSDGALGSVQRREHARTTALPGPDEAPATQYSRNGSCDDDFSDVLGFRTMLPVSVPHHAAPAGG